MKYIYDFIWNGNRLWFWRSTGDLWQLIEYDLTTDQMTTLIHDAAQVGDFSPDQTKALFYRVHDQQAELWLWDGQHETKLDTYPKRQLETASDRWTEDNRFIVSSYFINRPQPPKIMIIPIVNPHAAITMNTADIDSIYLAGSGQLLYRQDDTDQQHLYWLDFATQTEQKLLTADTIERYFNHDEQSMFYLWWEDQTAYFGGFWFETRQWFEYAIPNHWQALETFESILLPLHQQILFLRSGQNQIWLVSPSRAIELTLSSRIDRVSWSPDHRFVALHGQTITFLDVTTDQLQTLKPPSLSANYRPLRWGRCPLIDYPR